MMRKSKASVSSPMGFILGFGIVSMLMDIVYEAALSVQGPLLYSVGATAAVVGLVSGLGEATSLAGRLVSGPAADRSGRYWLFAILGYAATGLAVPAMGFAGSVLGVSFLIVFERFGKSLRTPSRDAMLSHAASRVGRGKGFAFHEALDQVGAVAGPLIAAAILQVTHNAYGPALGVMLVPGLAAIGVLLYLRHRVPHPEVFEEGDGGQPAEDKAAGASKDMTAQPVKLPRLFWMYTGFCGLVLAGVGTFGVMSFHMVSAHIVSASTVAVLYAVAMGVDGVFALVTGSIYDKVGVRVLFALPVVSVIVPFFAFGNSLASVVAGVVLWGASLGIQESTMRAAVADMVPGCKRATSYGMFSVFMGVGSFVGAGVTGALYSYGHAAIIVYALVLEAAACMLLFLALCRAGR
ncbi:MFS transporter [Collinsella sp. KGMB02528]|uniref:MFS transporter n=1 Tax=Collinsella acetigenes TaxID=2713419 RepID=A0A7X9YJ66_9ACTN|nr:MFS transporter [Collinsella acetigenes]NMF55940.1 MFS transporter [Collinsella acetigenes]